MRVLSSLLRTCRQETATETNCRCYTRVTCAGVAFHCSVIVVQTYYNIVITVLYYNMKSNVAFHCSIVVVQAYYDYTKTFCPLSYTVKYTIFTQNLIKYSVTWSFAFSYIYASIYRIIEILNSKHYFNLNKTAILYTEFVTHTTKPEVQQVHTIHISLHLFYKSARKTNV